MTNKNLICQGKPFLLRPVGKDYLWGGNRLKSEYGKNLPQSPLAESWECSTHPDGLSTVGSGEYTGKTLKEVLLLHPEYVGTHPQMRGLKKDEMQADEDNLKFDGELPVLIKLIDAKENLSVQVHPTDAYAAEHENGQRGKTEMWYVMDSQKDSRLIYGFYHNMPKEKLRKSLQKGTIERYLQKVKIQKDDVFFIEAGTVHAIGAGALIAEVQENSDLTYRLYDYDRIDKKGKKRELHIEKAIETANLESSAKPRQPMRILRYRKGMASELLCRCRYFQVERLLLNTESTRRLVEFRTKTNSFQVYLCMDGCGVLFFGQESLNFFKGDCIFIPADSAALKLHGKAQFLKVTC